jgi:hypothetical protein
MGKFSELFDSLAWNAAMSLLSIAVLASYLVPMIAARSFAPGGVLFIVWIVIAYHFITVSYKQYKEKLRHETSDE